MGAWSTSAAHEARDGHRQPSRAKDDSARRPIEAEANRLVETYADTILRVSYTYLRSTQDAEDICQDVLLKALGHAGSFDSAEHERAWIIRVAINAAKDLLRRRDRQGTVALDDIAEPVAPMGATDRELEARAKASWSLSWPCPWNTARRSTSTTTRSIPSSRSRPSSTHPNRPWQRDSVAAAPSFAPPWKELDMSSTFDPTSYRSDLNRLSFSDEQKAHMAARLAETASDRTAEAKEARENGTGKILELHGAGAAHSASKCVRRPKARRGRAQRIAAALGIAAMLTIGGGTAYATGTLARAADSLAAVFGAGPAQTELIDRIGRPIGASCTSNGITITADAIIGMRHAYAVVYTIEKDDGTAFDQLTMNENGHYNLFLEGGGNINALTALRLGVQGGHGGAYTFDADPSDNAIQLMEMMSLTGTDASLSGETLHFDAIKLLYMPTSADGQRDLPVETIATGDWNMSFKIDYDDLSVDLPAGQSFTVNGHNAVVDELAISPLGATITYTVDAVDGPSEPTGLETNSESRAGYGNFSVTFTDGTTEEIGSGYGSWREDGKTVVQKTRLFDQIRDVDDIASITVGDLTVPIQ